MSQSARFLIAVLALTAFTAFTGFVALADGPLGFIQDVALASRWGVQVLLDLFIGLTLWLGWMVRDARHRGLPAIPYVVATFALGSIGALAYMVHREGAALRAQSVSARTEPA